MGFRGSFSVLIHGDHEGSISNIRIALISSLYKDCFGDPLTHYFDAYDTLSLRLEEVTERRHFAAGVVASPGLCHGVHAP